MGSVAALVLSMAVTRIFSMSCYRSGRQSACRSVALALNNKRRPLLGIPGGALLLPMADSFLSAMDERHGLLRAHA